MKKDSRSSPFSTIGSSATSGFSMKKAKPRVNPLDEAAPLTGDPEADCLATMDAVRQLLLDADRLARAGKPVGELVIDECWGFIVVFETREQKVDLLQKLNLFSHADKYLDGYVVADVLGVDMTGKRKAPWSPPKIAALAGQKKGLSFGFSSSMQFGKKKEAPKEVGETLKNIRADEKKTAGMLAWTSDPEFWFSVSFRSREDADRFLAAMGLEAEHGRLIWGYTFAEKLGLDVPACEYQYRPAPAREDKRLCALVRFPGDS